MIGERLKALRTKNGLTQQELAEILNVSGMTISFYENEQRTPDSNFIFAAAKYFNVSSDYLLGLTNAVSNKRNINISRVTGLDDNSIDLLEQSTKETNNTAAEIINTIMCTGSFYRLVHLINDIKTEELQADDVVISDILNIKIKDILSMDMKQRSVILNKLFPMYKNDTSRLQDFEIEQCINDIAHKLKVKYKNNITVFPDEI